MKNVVLNGKKAKIILLVGLMFMLMIGASMALAVTRAKAETNGKLIFNLINGGTEYDVCIDDKSQTRIVIPSKYKGKPVTSITNNGFASSQSLDVVVIPSSIKRIGTNAFLNCKNLKTVIMSNIEEIGTNAFALCPKILQIVIKDTVDKIGATAFRGFTNEATIYVEPKSMKPNWNTNCFGSCNATVLYNTYTPTDLSLEPMTRDGIDGYRINLEHQIDDPTAEIIISPNNTPDKKPILKINSLAFTGTRVDKIVIQDSIYPINIKSYAFTSCSANTIDLGMNVTYFDDTSEEIRKDPLTNKLISSSVFSQAEAFSISSCFNHHIIPRDMFSFTQNLESLIINGNKIF